MSNDDAAQARCAALTKSGAPCRNRPLAGSTFCRVHQGARAVAPAPAEAEGTAEQFREELDRLIARVQEKTPSYTPPPFSPQALVRLVEDVAGRFGGGAVSEALSWVRENINSDLVPCH